MTQTRITQIDEHGEPLEGFVAYIAPRRRNGFQEGWVAMAQHPMEMLAQSDLRGDDLRVLLALLGRLDFENLLVLNQAELARTLGLARQNVQRSIRALMRQGVLLEGPRIGISRSYRLNPNYGWKGGSAKHVSVLDEERQKRRAASGISGVIEGGAGRDPNTGDLFDDEPA